MLRVYGHPLASFYWKALIAIYERGVPFEFLMVDAEHPENQEAVRRFSPTGQFPVLIDADNVVIESAAIIDYLDLRHGEGPPLIPADRRAAIDARQMDAVFDDYVQAPLTRMVLNAIRKPDERDPLAETEAKQALDKSYAFLDRWMTGRDWAAAGAFTIADCAAAPALFYAHWGYAIPERLTALRAYRARLMQRPSIARVIAEARPWFGYFPLRDNGSPD